MTTFGTVTIDIDELLGTDDRPARGYVTFVPASRYLPDVDGQAIVVHDVVKSLGRDVVSVELLAGIVWTATLSRVGANIEPVTFQLEAGETIDIATVTPPVSESLEVTVIYNAGLKADKSALDAESAAREAADDDLTEGLMLASEAIDAESAARIANDALKANAADLTALAASLPATYVPRDLATARTIVLGDSIDAGASGSATDDGGRSIFSLVCAMSGQRMRFLRNAGVPGDTTAQMLARLDAEVLAYNPDVVLLGGPTNDHGASVAESVTRANYAELVTRIRAAGAVPMIRNTVPIASVNAYKIDRHNAWLREWTQQNGIPLLDYYTPLVDATTGGPRSGLTDDGIHPNAAGRLVVAAHVAARLPSFLAGSVRLTGYQADAINLVTGGTFNVDTDVNGYADGWANGGGTFTPALVTDAAIIGKWQQATIATTGLGYFQQAITTGWAVGDRLAIACLVDKPAGTAASVQLSFNTGSPIRALFELSGALAGTIYGEGVVPVGATTLHARVVLNYAAGSIKVARMTVLNLTALGL